MLCCMASFELARYVKMCFKKAGLWIERRNEELERQLFHVVPLLFLNSSTTTSFCLDVFPLFIKHYKPGRRLPWRKWTQTTQKRSFVSRHLQIPNQNYPTNFVSFSKMIKNIFFKGKDSRNEIKKEERIFFRLHRLQIWREGMTGEQ